MIQQDPGSRQLRVPVRRESHGEEAADRRWPGALMVLLFALALFWPLGGMGAAVIAYLIADREQATFLFCAAVIVLILRSALAG
jgi:hypothetical protein